MTLEKQQKYFDDAKWFDSIQAGADRCGSYEFCNSCNKKLSYPCARAAKKSAAGAVRVAVVRKKRTAK